MFRKFFFTALVLCGIPFFSVTDECFAGVLEQLERVEIYKYYPAQAESIYQQIKADYPGSEYALTAHKNLVFSYLSAKRYDDAAQSLNQLTSDFAGNSGLPAALYEVAKVYERTRKYEDAKALYQQIAQQYPDSAFASKVQLDLPKTDILSDIESKKYNEAAAGIETLVADFNDHSYLPNCLYDIARRYERAKQSEQAKVLYNRIIQGYPDSSAVGASQLALARVNIYGLIKSGAISDAETATVNLLGDFAGHSDLSEALYDIAIRYDRVGNYDKAKGIYQRIVELFPTSSHAARASLDISGIHIFSLIKSGDDAKTQSAIDSLIADFSGHSHLPRVLLPIAKKYQNASKYKQQRNVYNLIIQHYPESNFARRAELFRSKIEIYPLVDSDLHNDVNEAVVEMIGDFNDLPQHDRAAFRVGERYFRKALGKRDGSIDPNAPVYFRKAIEVFEKIIDESGDSEFKRHSHYFSAICHRRLGEHEEAIAHYQKIVSSWPEYVYAGRAWYWMAQCYKSLKESGTLPASEADPQVEQAYTTIVEQYPDCKWVDYACIKLARMKYDGQEWAEAAKYFELFLEIVEPDDPRVKGVKAKLKELAEMNK